MPVLILDFDALDLWGNGVVQTARSWLLIVWGHPGGEFVIGDHRGGALLSLEHPDKNEGSLRGWSVPWHGRKMANLHYCSVPPFPYLQSRVKRRKLFARYTGDTVARAAGSALCGCSGVL